MLSSFPNVVVNPPQMLQGNTNLLSSSGPLTDKLLAQLNKNISTDCQGLPTLNNRSSRAYSQAFSPVEYTEPIYFPDYLLAQLNSVECKCFMGIFPEIKRVWLTIDNRLTLWSYEDPANFYSFEGMSDIIVTVGLVKAKPGIFKDKISHLLVVVTCAEIQTFGVAIQEEDDIALFRTDISLRPDTFITCVAGTDSGQIFLGSMQGLFYELQYQAEEQFFSRKCSLVSLNASFLSNFIPSFLASKPSRINAVVVDEERSLVYTLSDDSEISVYFINKSGTVQFITSRRCVDECKRFGLRNSGINVDPESMFIISLQIIPSDGKQSGKHLGLMAVTSRGYRLYFSLAVRPDGQFGDFELSHVRSLPSIEDEGSENIRSIPFTHFESCAYSAGTFFVAGTSAQSGHVLFASSCDLAKSSKVSTFFEWNHIATAPQRVWAIETESYAGGRTLNNHVSQLIEPPKVFIILTNAGVIKAVETRPAQNLALLISRSGFRETREIRSFLDNYSEDQSACMCLALACGNQYAFNAFVEPQICAFANQLFLTFASRLRNALDLRGDYEMARAYSQMKPQQQNYDFILINASLLYFSRLISTCWNLKVFSMTNFQGYTFILQNLETLRLYLSKYAETLLPQDSSDRIQLESLIQIIDLSIQGLEFIRFLLPIGIHNLKIDKDLKNFASSCTFSTLISTQPGLELVKEYAHVVVIDIIQKNSNVDPFCDRLKGKCPLLFKAEDVKIYKAQELIQKAQMSKDDPIGYLEDAMRLLRDSASVISVQLLREFAQTFSSFGHANGIIKLAVICGQRIDPGNCAFLYYKNHNLTEFTGIYHARLEFYNVAIDLIHELVHKMPKNVDSQTQEFYQNSALIKELATVTDDQLFMYTVFDYMEQHRQLVFLLRVPQMPFLEDYLSYREPFSPDAGFFLALLARYKHQYLKAMQKLESLATSTNPNTTLDQRISYLAQAVNICYSHLSNELSPQIIAEIQDLYDVALLQMDILREIELKIPGSKYTQQLHRELKNVQELYQLCEDNFLFEAKLSVFKVSGYRDDDLLRDTWKRILLKLTNEEKVAKIVALGVKLALNENVFPIDLILSLLEEEAFEQSSIDPNTWIGKALVDAGCSYNEVVKAYDQIYQDRRPPFHSRDGQLYLIMEILQLIKSWVDSKSLSVSDAKFIDEKLSRFKSVLAAIEESRATYLLTTVETLRQNLPLF